MIQVVATVELHPDSRKAFLAEIDTLTPTVQAEDGCLAYCAYVDVASGLAAQTPPRPDAVTIIEQWTNLSALLAHAVAPHMQAYRKRVANLVVKTILQVLGRP